MMRDVRGLFTCLLLLFVVSAAPAVVGQEEETETASVALDSWLVAGPVEAPLPAFAAETGGDVTEAVGVAALLPAASPIEAGEPWPAAGDELAFASGDRQRWSARQGAVTLEAGARERPRVAWLAAFVEVDRFVEATLEVSSPHLVRAFLDGEQVGEKKDADAADEDGENGDGEDGEGEQGDGEGGDGEEDGDADGEDAADAEPGTASGKVKLTTGKHLLLVATVLDPEVERPWRVTATLEVPAERQASVAVSTDPTHGVRMTDLLDVPGVTGLDVSAAGDLVAVMLQKPQVPSEDHADWVEIVRAADGERVRTLRLPGSLSGFSFAPRGHGFAYRTSGDGGKATLWVGDLDGGELRPLLEDVEGLGSHLWAPDGRSLFVQVSDEPEEDETGVVRVRGLQDRWAGFRDLGRIEQVSVADGLRRRLTAGPLSTDLLDVAPDGRSLLFSRTRSVRERPFTVGELWELDLATLEPRRITEVVWLGAAAYSPDGRHLLVGGGPSAFGELGRDVPEGTLANDYDGQLYLLDRATGAPRALTRDFDPSVVQAEWSADGRVYLVAAEGEYVRLFRLDPGSGRIEHLPTEVDVVDGIAVADAGATLAYAGSSLQTPARVFAVTSPGAGRLSSRLLLHPGRETFERVEFGRAEDFDFQTADGTSIDGRLYYPLDFDPAKKYPLIVYYYGGTTPTERSFGGRYPKNLWAANGYAVYVLQPSGAIGYGQEFSARHVNDWGQVVASEIEEGVRRVLAAHPFLDAERVGNFGGSYGGFLTMLLITRSDLFDAAISHAGISFIPSYWGEGWWGYLYNAVSAAECYPWNCPEVYLQQSPLLAAERIETPLLLLHGTADPNVPPGESDQMFAALRVLGKEVEYVRFEGEQHWILSYPKRILWWQTILAWFDLHLKDQPEAWNSLYPTELDRTGP
ncbi:MAG TPA: S9 family peptidase [Thermoanaerobaculia bacterium]|nr:S9 family peptidase [Thermoanaerobaculia bacterium]